MTILHLNGWPGVGKLTVGRLLAARLGARLIDNHLLHDVAIRCTGIDDPGRWPLYETVRQAAYEALAGRPHGETFVMTNALCVNSARENEAWRHVVDLAIRRQVPLVPIVLQARMGENARRLQSAERRGRKLTDPAALRDFARADSIQMPDVPERLVLDTTDLSADQAVEAIQQHLTLLVERRALRTANRDHLRFRAGAPETGET